MLRDWDKRIQKKLSTRKECGCFSSRSLNISEENGKRGRRLLDIIIKKEYKWWDNMAKKGSVEDKTWGDSHSHPKVESGEEGKETSNNNKIRIREESWHPAWETEPDTAVRVEAFPGSFAEGPILCNDWEKLQQSVEGRSWMREGAEG